jgi:hypothetical protein
MRFPCVWFIPGNACSPPSYFVNSDFTIPHDYIKILVFPHGHWVRPFTMDPGTKPVDQDVYESGSYCYIMMKGESYFKPSSSWWYVQGGPRELHYKQYLLRVAQGFERNATVGFRCIKDK